jgi:hypothetical protein
MKLGLQIGAGILIPNHLGPVTMMAQQETLTTSQIIFITLFSPRAQCWCAFDQSRQTVELC